MTAIARTVLVLVLALVGVSNCAFSQFVYLTTANDQVSAYRFDAQTRVLTQAPGSPFAAGVAPAGVAVDPSNRFVYVANSGSNDVSAYMIDSATGALTPVARSPFAAGAGPVGIAVGPAGRFLYVANSASSDVSAYTIDAATGALTPVPGSPFAAGAAPARVTLDPAGRFLYVTNSGSGSVSAYRIDATSGALAAVPGSPFAAGRNAVSVAIDPTGRLAYVTSADRRDHSLRVFAIDPASGELAVSPGSPLAAGGGPLSVALHPSGEFVYVTNGGDITAYAAGANRAASRLVSVSRVAPGTRWSGLIADPAGNFVYAANDQTSELSVYAVDSRTGALQPVAQSALATSAPRGIAISAAASVAPSGTPLVTGFPKRQARNNYSGGFGMKFTVGAAPLKVTALGRIYIEGNAGSHVISLVSVKDGSDVPGGSATVSFPSGATTPGEFAYAALASPVTLDANTAYYLVSSEAMDGDQFFDLGPVTTTNAVSVDVSIVFWPGYGFIPVGPPNHSYGPVNLLYEVPGAPPSIAITAPAAGATVSGDKVTVMAAATASSGLTITGVQFQLDNAALGALVTTAPYSVVLDTTKLSNTAHSLVAIATDSANSSTVSAPVSITVNNIPVVAITAPAPGATVSGNKVAVTAAATAAPGLTIASVQFKLDNAALGAPVTSSPYGVVLDSTKLSNSTHSLVAEVTDSSGNSATSLPLTFTVNNTSTSVALTAPLPGAKVSGSVTLTAAAKEGTGLSVSGVQFKVNNVNYGPPVTTSPYSIVLDTTKLANGLHTLSAEATDSSNKKATSSPVSITADNGGPPPPETALITGFTPNAVRNNFTGGLGMKFTVGPTPLNVTALGRIYLEGNQASHLVKLVRVSDGSDVPGGSVNIALPSGTPGQFAYARLASPVTLDANASYYLISAEIAGGDQFYNLGPVTATNVASVDSGIVFWPEGGFVAVGPPNRSYVPVNLLYSTGSGAPPAVAITAPAAGATVSGNNVPVSAKVTPATGLTIASVQFTVDQTNHGAAVTTSPYGIVLDTTKLTNGVHSVAAMATDSANNSATSPPVSFTVNNNPTVSISAPAPGAAVSGSKVAVTASASAVTGLTIASVQFKVDDVPLGAPATTSPYGGVLDSTKLTNGTHSLVAVATDSANNTATSAPVSITVVNTTTTVAITSPLAGTTVSGNVTVTATATPGTGVTIGAVQFKVDNTNQAAPVTTSPYSIVLDTTTLPNGVHTLSAVATDSSNNTVTSAPVSITVGNTGPPPSGTPLITGFTSGGLRNNFSGGFGMKLTVGATPLNVTALGRIFLAGNTGTHLVRLVRASDSSDVPGGSVSISLPSGTAGQFVYAPLANPVTLDANTSYYLVSDEVNGGDQFCDLGTVVSTSAVSVDSGIVFWPGFGFVAVGPPNRSYVPVSLLYTSGP